IITKEQFDRVQILLDRHKGRNAHKAKEALLSGLMICGCCGENYVTWSSGTKAKRSYGRNYRYYLCRVKRFPSEYDKKCTNKNWNSQKIEELISEEIKNLLAEKKLTN